MIPTLDPNTLTEPVQAKAALYFLDGHFLFKWLSEDQRWESKFVTIDDVAASLANVENDSGWLGDGILRAGRSARGEWFVYAAAPTKITIQLAFGDQREITVPIPATVLVGVKHSYYLLAAKDAQIKSNTLMYWAPFPNLYSNGRICWGANRPPVAHHTVAQKVWSMFFGTPFNKHLANGKSKKAKSDVTEVLLALSAGAAKRYELDDLVPVNRTLNDVVTRILNRDWKD